MPALRRHAKQLIYGVIFIIVIFVFFFIVVAPRFSFFGRQSSSPPSPNRESIIIESIDPVVHGQSVDIVARIRNPNAKAGIPQYSIIFVLLDDADNEISRITKDTYLLPGALSYIAALDVPLSGNLARVKVETPNEPVFAELPSNVSAPSFNSFLRDRRHRSLGTTLVEEQKGVVTNISTLGFRHVDITGVALDSAGKVVGISTTFIGEFQVGEQREFTIQWPSPTSTTERVIVLPTTNVYQEDNIFSIQGDPSLLRD